jgi:glutamyl-tRNA reductase
MVVGEPQILGQMKDAYRASVEAGACGPILSRLFQRAFAAAKRVRNETAVAERPISVARVAVDLARQIFEDFDDKAALLVGAGEMIELALQALRGQGLRSVRVANRTAAHAAKLASRFDASAHGLEELPELLARSDVVLTCIGGDRPLVTLEMVRAALHRRRERPLFLIDIGVPRNVEATVNRIDNAYLYDLDDLSSLAEANAEERRRETLVAEAIVLEEQQRFDGWLAAHEAVPTIRRLRSRAETIRRDELERSLGRLGLAEPQLAAVERLTRAIVNKLLHAPISRLRDAAERDDGLAHLEAARTLFALDDGDAPDADSDGDEQDEPEGTSGR